MVFAIRLPSTSRMFINLGCLFRFWVRLWPNELGDLFSFIASIVSQVSSRNCAKHEVCVCVYFSIPQAFAQCDSASLSPKIDFMYKILTSCIYWKICFCSFVLSCIIRNCSDRINILFILLYRSRMIRSEVEQI